MHNLPNKYGILHKNPALQELREAEFLWKTIKFLQKQILLAQFSLLRYNGVNYPTAKETYV
jgi:hypothetical protein